MKTIARRYFEETGLSAYKFNWLGRRIHNQSYIDWLEKQCAINGVSNCRCKKPVKCGNCDEMVVMVSTGEICPSCYC